MTERPHLSRALLDACFEGRISPHELVAEVARLLEGECDGCKSRLADSRADYQRALREAGRRIQAELPELEAEHTSLPPLLQELASRPDPEPLLRIARDHRFHTTAFVSYELAAAWAAVESEDWRRAREAADLARLTAARLEAGRYGQIAVARLRAEAQLIRARVAVVLGWDRDLTRALDALEGWVPASVSDDLRAGLLLGRSVSALRAGEERTARRHLQRAESLAVGGRAERWRPSIETMLAALDHRAGRPEVAAERLRKLLPRGTKRPSGPVGWRAARELIAALVTASETKEAGAFIAAWEGEPELPPGRGESLELAVAELAHLRAMVLRHSGQPERATALLRRAITAHATLDRGLRAIATAAELARADLGTSTPGPASEWLGRDLDALAMRLDLPGEALVALTRFRGVLCRGTLSHPEIDQLEEDLFHLDPPWGPAHHEPP